MIGDEELARLAQLLRLAGDTARAIARARGADVSEICQVSDKAEALANQLDKVARGGRTSMPADQRH